MLKTFKEAVENPSIANEKIEVLFCKSICDCQDPYVTIAAIDLLKSHRPKIFKNIESEILWALNLIDLATGCCHDLS